MNRPDFVEFMDGQYAEITKINREKGHDYAGDDDALSNFKRAAERLGMTAEQIWGVYASKHWASIETFIKEGDVKSEPIEGRLHDIILYCFLLLGLIEEKKREPWNGEDPQAAHEIHEAQVARAIVTTPIPGAPIIMEPGSIGSSLEDQARRDIDAERGGQHPLTS